MTTWNPSDNSDATLSNGNLTASFQTSSSSWHSCRATTFKTAGKLYFEDTLQSSYTPNTGFWLIGVGNSSANLLSFVGASPDSGGFENNGVLAYAGAPTFTGWSPASLGDVIGIAIDIDNGLFWARDITTGSDWNVTGSNADPATGAAGFNISGIPNIHSSGITIMCTGYFPYGSVPDTHGLNVGPSGFVGVIPSGFSPWDAGGGTALVIDRPLAIEWAAVSGRAGDIISLEILARGGRDGAVPIENRARAIRDEPTPADSTARVAFHLGLPSIEALSGQRVEIGAAREALMTAVVNANFRGEALGAVTAKHTIESEFLQTRLNTSDSLLAIEWLKTALSDQSIGDEWLGAIHRVSTAELELAKTLLHHVGAPGEITGSARGDSSLPDEATGTLTTLLANAAIPIEVNGSIAVAGDGIATEIIARAIADIRVPAEFLSFARHDEPARAEFLAGLSMRDNAVAFELLALLHSLHRLPIEWSALPAIMRVSLQRLLASPSKRRILGTPGRFRLLKHQ